MSLPIRPYGIQDSELIPSNKWWRNLSINQGKALQQKYYPNYPYYNEYFVHKMWIQEGKPEPQELIPVDSRFLV